MNSVMDHAALTTTHPDHRRQPRDPRGFPQDPRPDGDSIWRKTRRRRSRVLRRSADQRRPRRISNRLRLPGPGGPRKVRARSRAAALTRWPSSMCACRRAGMASRRSRASGKSFPICRSSSAPPTPITRGRRLPRLGKSDRLILKKPFDNVEVLQLAHALSEKVAAHPDRQSHLADSTSSCSRGPKSSGGQCTACRKWTSAARAGGAAQFRGALFQASGQPDADGDPASRELQLHGYERSFLEVPDGTRASPCCRACPRMERRGHLRVLELRMSGRRPLRARRRRQCGPRWQPDVLISAENVELGERRLPC